MEEKRSYAVPVIAGVLLLLPCLYVGSYYALVEPTSILSLSYDDVTFLPYYSVGGETAKAAFYPVHRLDRLVRPSHWQIDPSRIGVDFDFNIDEPDSPADDPTVDCLP